MSETIEVEFRIKGEVFDPSVKPVDGTAGMYGNRMVRRLLTAQATKLRKKFGHLQHPDTGERPLLVVNIPNPSERRIEHRLVTDSEPLRQWLKEKGLVIEDVSESESATSVAA